MADFIMTVIGFFPWQIIDNNIFLGHAIEIFRAFDRVTHGSQHKIGIRFFHMLNGHGNIIAVFIFKAPHQKHAGFDAVPFRKHRHRLNLFGFDTALHFIQQALRAAFRANPDAEAAHGAQCRHNFFIHAIGATDAFKRNFNLASFQFGGIIA